jgi:hypothetical protein
MKYSRKTTQNLPGLKAEASRLGELSRAIRRACTHEDIGPSDLEGAGICRSCGADIMPEDMPAPSERRGDAREEKST